MRLIYNIFSKLRYWQDICTVDWSYKGRICLDFTQPWLRTPLTEMSQGSLSYRPLENENAYFRRLLLPGLFYSSGSGGPCRVVMVLQAGNDAKPDKVRKWSVFFLRHFVKDFLFFRSHTKSNHVLPHFFWFSLEIWFSPFILHYPLDSIDFFCKKGYQSIQI